MTPPKYNAATFGQGKADSELPAAFVFNSDSTYRKVETMVMIPPAVLQSSRNDKPLPGWSTPDVLKAAFSNGTRPAALPTDDAGLLDEASELLNAAHVIQSWALGRVPADGGMVLASLITQKKRLVPILECDLFEPIYQPLYMACQAAETMRDLRKLELKTILNVWEKAIPQTDFFSALVWVSREWKRTRKVIAPVKKQEAFADATASVPMGYRDNTNQPIGPLTGSGVALAKAILGEGKRKRDLVAKHGRTVFVRQTGGQELEVFFRSHKEFNEAKNRMPKTNNDQ